MATAKRARPNACHQLNQWSRSGCPQNAPQRDGEPPDRIEAVGRVLASARRSAAATAPGTAGR
jgi:hypothetical protein